MSTITLIGPGAIGGTIAAWLAQNPQHQVTVAVRSRFTDLEVDTPYGPFRAAPRVITDPAQAEPADWVLVATKAYDVDSTAAWFEHLLAEKTHVAVLQNGVEHVERFAAFMPAHRILPVMIDCPAERTAPGRIRQRGPAKMVVPQGDAGAAFVSLFTDPRIDVSEHADFRTQIWRKLCLNSVGAFSAILLRPAVIARHDALRAVMGDVIRECIAVGRAEGAQLDDSLVETILEGYRKAPPDSVNSMHADRIAGQAMEIDARNGAIVRIGRRHGIATPLNSLIVTLLEAAALPGP